MRRLDSLIIVILALLFAASGTEAREKKKTPEKLPLTHSLYDGWKSVENAALSNDGSYASFEVNPQRGDGMLYIRNMKTGRLDSVPRGCKARFSGSNDFVAFQIRPQFDSVRAQKLAKKKKEDLPKDSLGIWVFGTDSIIKFERVKNFNLPKENSEWLAFLREKELEKKDAAKDSTKAEKKEVKEENKSAESTAVSEKKEMTEEEKKAAELKKEEEKKVKEKKDAEEKKRKKQEGTELVIMNPKNGKIFKYENISEYDAAAKGAAFAFVSVIKDSVDSSKVFVFNPGRGEALTIAYSDGTAKGIVMDEKGEQAAYVMSQDTAKTKAFSLYYWGSGAGSSKMIADSATPGMLKGWCPSENGKLSFSRSGGRLFFGNALKPESEPKDTLTDDEKFKLDVWSWNDPFIQPQQLKNLDDELKRTYKAVWFINDSKMLQLADEDTPDAEIKLKGDGNIAYLETDVPYRKMSTWEYPWFRDIYLTKLPSGEKKKVLTKVQFDAVMSPNGKYVIWYSQSDSAWHSYSVETGKYSVISKSIPHNQYDEDNDVPALPSPYGIAGWTDNDESVLIYDKYDIWKVDPSGMNAASCLTREFGRKNKTVLRYMKLDPDAETISSGESMMVYAVNEETKREGYYTLNLGPSGEMRKLIEDDYNFLGLSKAKYADKIIWRKQSYTVYPDYYYSGLNFEKPERLTNANPQGANYKWGTVEIIKWQDFSGKECKGLLYKPENFDAKKKYPMVVYFYEKYTQDIHRHYVPKPTASIIFPSLYASNDYVVFIPDIYYETGHPGKSAYNVILSGTMNLIDKGFVNKDKIGLQGQSWGGYQTAYMITQTPLFAAAMAGAPVSNMTSAYGGIRWESGMARTFQYEKSQSRIGSTLWDRPDLYIENSPLFFADRVKTPLLIMANDNDGAVPWYQGIEYFNALRRLGRQVWMLNYNGDEHNLMKRPNRMDLSIRMMQFFDHFLKDAPAPEWLENGIPAVKKGKTDGLKLIEGKK